MEDGADEGRDADADAELEEVVDDDAAAMTLIGADLLEEEDEDVDEAVALE